MTAEKPTRSTPTRWFAVRTVPGAQRMAARATGLPANREGESVVERNLRNEGIDVYMPSAWAMVRHQRTRKVIEKRFPMLVGYAFVHLPRLEFEKVRQVEGVMCFLRNGRDGGPMWFSEERDLWPLMKAEWESKTQYLAEKARKLEAAKTARRNQLNRQLGILLPKGRKRRVSMRCHAEQAINNLTPDLRERVLGIIGKLDQLEDHEGLAELDVAV